MKFVEIIKTLIVKYTTLLSALTLFFLATMSCQPVNKYYDSRLKLENKTDKYIVAYYSYAIPDTSLDATLPHSVAANNWIAGPGGEITFERGGTWENAFRDNIPSGKLSMFVLDKQVVDNTPWDSIRQHYTILKRFDVTIDSLRAINFKLIVQ